ncbi:MAG: UDP-N-acetylmuramoyl-tripeptide--D-alanyl-D-alanine ligase [Actinomycetota bacterium]|jgi:UDP-N-acetylmuramoyl-tripeptide--D-alanyl-D-alanine ligase|nr:UDP-N-acetylmuramoyl-tripeptide--D-alanyl-D-alanine ligase [Actinomycetota bacterium]
MNRADPFTGYSLVLRTIIYVLIPAFTAFQYFRLRRGLHVFQLEGYKRPYFLRWCRANPQLARFLKPLGNKKPLAMTGRAWRILVTATFLNAIASLVIPGMAHLMGGAPYDLITWAVVTVLLFFSAPRLLTVADILMTPIQSFINSGYQRKARARLDRVGPVVIGVTGSFGKTSTKFAIAQLLGGSEAAFATPGSYNTPMGVVRAINEGLEDTHRFVVIEMGAYREGDIAQLCDFARHSIGVLTAIGPAHLERFGSMDAIKRAKYEIIQKLPRDGVAVMNTDDLNVRALADRTTGVPVVRYGIDRTGEPNVTARDHSYSPQGTVATIVDAEGGELRITTKLLGEHAIQFILAGVAIARIQGIPLADLGPRIEAMEPVEHRLQLIKGAGGVTVIDDAFNSNPSGAAAALEVLADFDETDANQIVVVTPGIVELGELQSEANERFGRHAATVADHLIVVGRVNRDAIVRGATGEGDLKAEVIVVDTLDDATERLKTLLKPGDVVLFENDLPDQYEV